MLTLSSTLRTAQKQYDILPAISALVADIPPEVPRLAELAPAFLSFVEPDVPFDAGFTQTGKIVRIWINGSVRVSIADVAVPVSWGTYTALDVTGGTTAGACQVALWCSQVDGTIQAFWVANDNFTIKTAFYDGSAWSASSVVYAMSPGHTITGLASDGMDPTKRLYFVEAVGALYETHWTGVGWSAPLSDLSGYNGVVTIAAGYRPVGAPNGTNDAFVMVAHGSPLQTVIVKQFGIASFAGWGGAVTTVLSAGTGTGYTYSQIKLSETRADSLRSVITWSEKAPAPIGTAPQIAFTPTHSSVQGAVPWRYAAGFGIKVFRDRQAVPKWWFITSNSAYWMYADRGDYASGQRVAFAQNQIRSFRLDVPKPNVRSRGVLTVLNEGGYLASAGLTGPYRGLRPWSQVSVSLGYRSIAGGLEMVKQLPLWIDGIVFHDEARTGEPLVSFHLVDTWGILESLRFRSTLTFTGQTVDYILEWCLWHVLGNLASYGAPLSTVTLSTFTVHAGEQIAGVVQRLCDLLGVALVFRTLSSSADGTGFDSVGVSVVTVGSGASVYSYGPAAHPVVQSELEVTRSPLSTGVSVIGSTTQSIVRNWVPTWNVWRDSLERIVDKTLANQAATDAVAAGEAGELLTGTAGGSISVLANVAQEIGDKIDVTIATAPVSATLFTVAGMVLTYSDPGGSGELLQVLKLRGTQ